MYLSLVSKYEQINVEYWVKIVLLKAGYIQRDNIINNYNSSD